VGGRAESRASRKKRGCSYGAPAASLWTARPKLRAGVELIVAGEDLRAQLELRYSFP